MDWCQGTCFLPEGWDLGVGLGAKVWGLGAKVQDLRPKTQGPVLLRPCLSAKMNESGPPPRRSLIGSLRLSRFFVPTAIRGLLGQGRTPSGTIVPAVHCPRNLRVRFAA
jgi:hypothetical protein